MPEPVAPDDEHVPQFMLLLSSACPASCSYCFGPHSGPVISAATLESTLEFIVSASQKKKSHVTFHGGEPLAAGHALFRQAIEGLRARLGCECKLSVQSNLWLLDDAFCELFAENGVRIGTSLDGPENITDLQRGKGYFERSIAGINRARAHGLSVGCIATFTPAIASRWRAVLDFFRAERIDFTVHAAVPPLSQPGSPFSLSVAAYGDMLRELLDAWNNLYLHVTFACQLHCTHCYAVADSEGTMMATPAVLEIVGQAQAAGFRQLVVTGGEPLMHADRGAILAGLREARERVVHDAIASTKPTRIVLRTNFALPLTEDELAAVAGAFDQVVVSVDGTRQAHDARRGPGSYDAALGNMERYQALALSPQAELSLSTVMALAELDGDQEISV